MRLAMIVAMVGAASGTAMASPQFAAVSLGSVTPASAASILASGEGTRNVGLVGELGPFSPGQFTVMVSLSFESFSVPGDGVAATFSMLPSFGSGSLALSSFQIGATLYDGADMVSSLAAQGQASQGASSGDAFDLVAIATSFDREGAAPFEYIGDHGNIQLAMTFQWSGASSTDSLWLEVLPGSEVAYLTFIPAPGTAGVLALGALVGVRRRRN